jgi:antitoxin ParD1/3/4
MANRNVVLTENQAALIDQWVTSGRYQNASEVLQAALHLLDREEAEFQDLRVQLTVGLEQTRRGESAEGSGEEAIHRAFIVAQSQT